MSDAGPIKLETDNLTADKTMKTLMECITMLTDAEAKDYVGDHNYNLVAHVSLDMHATRLVRICTHLGYSYALSALVEMQHDIIAAARGKKRHLRNIEEILGALDRVLVLTPTEFEHQVEEEEEEEEDKSETKH